MTDTAADEPTTAPDGPDGSWRDRALERSLRAARAKAISRSDRFIQTAMELLQETGRTDFTVQELVDRSRTSLRSFYQYFSGKDELLLALLEETIAANVAQWRAEIEDKDALAGLEHLVRKIYTGGEQGDAIGLNRPLSSYHASLAESHSEDYRRALEPMGRLLLELIGRGAKDGLLRADIPADRLTRIVMQTVVGSALINSLSVDDSDRAKDAETLWEFCRVGLMSPTRT